MRMSPEGMELPYDQLSPDKLKIIELQQQLQLSDKNHHGVRQVRIKPATRNNHLQEALAYSNDTGLVEQASHDHGSVKFDS